VLSPAAKVCGHVGGERVRASRAAKWPPRSISGQRRMLNARSARERVRWSRGRRRQAAPPRATVVAVGEPSPVAQRDHTAVVHRKPDSYFGSVAGPSCRSEGRCLRRAVAVLQRTRRDHPGVVLGTRSSPRMRPELAKSETSRGWAQTGRQARGAISSSAAPRRDSTPAGRVSRGRSARAQWVLA
jgi:hypothetical protein